MENQSTSKSKRFANCLIDSLAIAGVSLLVGMGLLEINADEYILPSSVVVFIGYYFISEYSNGQTLGKSYTKTRVVILKKRNRWFWILVRSIMRLNPFDLISYLTGTNIGTHDLLSFTRVVDDI